MRIRKLIRALGLATGVALAALMPSKADAGKFDYYTLENNRVSGEGLGINLLVANFFFGTVESGPDREYLRARMMYQQFSHAKTPAAQVARRKEIFSSHAWGNVWAQDRIWWDDVTEQARRYPITPYTLEGNGLDAIQPEGDAGRYQVRDISHLKYPQGKVYLVGGTGPNGISAVALAHAEQTIGKPFYRWKNHDGRFYTNLHIGGDLTPTTRDQEYGVIACEGFSPINPFESHPCDMRPTQFAEEISRVVAHSVRVTRNGVAPVYARNGAPMDIRPEAQRTRIAAKKAPVAKKHIADAKTPVTAKHAPVSTATAHGPAAILALLDVQTDSQGAFIMHNNTRCDLKMTQDGRTLVAGGYRLSLGSRAAGEKVDHVYFRPNRVPAAHTLVAYAAPQAQPQQAAMVAPISMPEFAPDLTKLKMIGLDAPIDAPRMDAATMFNPSLAIPVESTSFAEAPGVVIADPNDSSYDEQFIRDQAPMLEEFKKQEQLKAAKKLPDLHASADFDRAAINNRRSSDERTAFIRPRSGSKAARGWRLANGTYVDDSALADVDARFAQMSLSNYPELGRVLRSFVPAVA